MDKRKYNRKKYTKNKRYPKKKKYINKKKKTLKQRGGSRATRKISEDVIKGFERSIGPSISDHPRRMSLQRNVLDRIYDGNAVELNGILFREKQGLDNEISTMNNSVERQLYEIKNDFSRLKRIQVRLTQEHSENLTYLAAFEVGTEEHRLRREKAVNRNGELLDTVETQLKGSAEQRRQQTENDLKYLETEIKKFEVGMKDLDKRVADGSHPVMVRINEKNAELERVMKQSPRLLILDCHGLKTKYLTLIPKGKELYLTTGTGESYYGMMAHAQESGQNFGSNRYLNCYTGLIQDYSISFDTYAGSDVQSRQDDIRYWSGGIYEKNAGICEGRLDEEKFVSSTVARTHYHTLQFYKWKDAHREQNEIAKWPTVGSRRKLQREITEYYINTLLEKHDIDIINRELMKYLILDNLRNCQRYWKLKLSNILQIINNKPDLPNKIIGLFCRSGDLPDLDIDSLIASSHKGLPVLTREYFSDTFSYGGAELTRQKSLSSDKKVQDFWDIYENIINRLPFLSEQLGNSWIIDEILIIQEKINRGNEEFASSEDTNCFMNGIPIGIQLEINEVALIFQCDIYLSLPEEERDDFFSTHQEEMLMPS